MGGMQTILALLSVVLFSSMTLNSYNNLLHQGDVMEVSYRNLQAQEIVDKYFQKIECNLAVGNYTASYVVSNITSIIPATEQITNPQGVTVAYTFTTRTASLCDKSGNTVASDQGIVLVQMALTSSYGGRLVTAGTNAKPLSAIFSEGL